MEKNVQLSDEVTKRILEEIVSGRFSKERFLPPEQELAKQFEVSRTIIRDSLSKLDKEGFISRKHGVGTIINHHVLAVKTRMDVEKEFLAMVEDAGHKAAISEISHRDGYADTEIAKKLSVDMGTPVMEVERIITADGHPAIYCKDVFPKSMIRVRKYPTEELYKPIFHFLKKYCDKVPQLDITQVKALAAEPWVAERLDLQAGTPILLFDEVDYDFYGTPILYAKQFFVGEQIVNTVIRQEI